MLQRALIGAALCVVLGMPAQAACRASWYGYESGSRTASGEPYRPAAESTCALPSFRARHKPYNVRVTNVRTGASVVCRVNDRGPASWTGKCIDLSIMAAKAIGMGPGKAGVATVEIRNLD